MNLRALRYLWSGITIAVSVVSLLALGRDASRLLPLSATSERRLAWSSRPMAQNVSKAPTLSTAQVIVGTPEFYTPTTKVRYTYCNELPKDQAKLRPLYVVDSATGQETRLGMIATAHSLAP